MNHNKINNTRQGVHKSNIAAIRDNININIDERNIAALIYECVKLGILEDCSNDTNGRFFRYKIKNTAAEYEIYFGAIDNSLRSAEHSGAERAIRASEFVTNLLKYIDSHHNYYIVPSDNITPPSIEAVAEYIGCNPSDLFLHTSKTTEGALYSEDNITHELEVRIIAKIGNKYKVIIEVVTVRKNADGTLSFKYSNYSHVGLPSFAENDSGAKEAAEKDKERAKKLFKFITGADDSGIENEKIRLERKAEHAKKILKALAASENSQFAKFLKELENEKTSVGQISVIPSSFFVGAAKEKTYVYSILGSNGKRHEFTLTWNKTAEAFNNQAPMYVVPADDGSFQGLTYSRTIKKGNSEPITLSKFSPKKDAIVVAHRLEGKKTVSDCATIRIEGGQDSLPSAYKEIKNYAIIPSAFSNDFITAYGETAKSKLYLHSEVCFLDSGIYHKEDCADCEYSHVKHWRGFLKRLAFVNERNVIQDGLVFKSLIEPKGPLKERTCDSCKNIFYAGDERYKKYKESKKLLNESICCDACCKPEKSILLPTLGLAKLIKAYKDDKNHSSQPDGMIFAKIAKNEELTDIDSGGNVFKCAGCNKTFFFSAKSDVKRCEICHSPICKVCADKFFAENLVVMNDNNAQTLHFCPSCPTDETPKVNGPRIYKNVREAKKFPPAKNAALRGAIYVDPEKTTKAYRCGFCGDLVFDNDKPCTCDCCGTAIEEFCYTNLPSHFRLKLCSDCRKKSDDQLSPKMKLLFAEIENVQKEISEDGEKAQWLKSWIVSKEGLEIILPLLPLGLRRNLKKNPSLATITIKKHSIKAIGDFKNLYACFEISVYHRKYRFNIIGKKITID